MELGPEADLPPNCRSQATAAWAPIRRLLRRRRLLSPQLRNAPGADTGMVSVWGLSQVLAAALDLAMIDAVPRSDLAEWWRVLRPYRDGRGYDAFPADRPRYYDDNAWIGLDLVQAHLQGFDRTTVQSDPLAEATGVLTFVAQGEDLALGGVYWREPPCASRHTCSSGPGGELAARLHLLNGDQSALAFAQRSQRFLSDVLRRDDKLYSDNVNDRGDVDHAIYSYNQGTPVGLDVLMFRITGDHAHLHRAHESTAAALKYFATEDRLWGQAPCFNAIFFRNLLHLDAVDHHPGVRESMRDYLERGWAEARNPASGWFSGGQVGRYEQGGVLDQSGWVQLFALEAMDPDQLLLIG